MEEDTRSTPPLIRDPADWAREAGWVSRLKAERAARRLIYIAEGIEGAFGDDEDVAWGKELRDIARYLTKKQH